MVPDPDDPIQKTRTEPRSGTATPTPKPHLFLTLEASRPLAAPARWRLDVASEVQLGRGNTRTRARLESQDHGLVLTVRVPDELMSAVHARLQPLDGGRWRITDLESRNGIRLNGAATKEAVLKDGDLVELGHTFFLFRDSIPARAEEPFELDLARNVPADPSLATLLPGLEELFQKALSVAASEVSVLIGGETGTGKERVARTVHARSGRSGDFVAVNCGAIPDTLVESELFGHRKGAFTGATTDRPGLVRTAHGGTLFLDEIGDLPLAAQAALLRVLQERQVLPVGGTRPIDVDFRIVCATHHRLDERIRSDRFRPDLFARLAGLEIVLPPLRSRREDLGLIIAAILGRIAPERATRVAFDADAARALFRYAFPLNIRELENALRVALALASNHVVTLEDLPEAVQAALHAPVVESRPPRSPRPATADALLEELRALLREHCGNITAVARAMGKDRQQIRRWLERFKLNRDDFRK